MKLNYKRTILVGFAFFLICLFWQVYDSIIPKILTDKFGLSHVVSGAIMAIDNILAVFLLPVFGAISDKKNSKLGKRTPFILVGTICAAVLFVGLSFADNVQLAHLEEISAVTQNTPSDERDSALRELYRFDSDSAKGDLSNIYGTEDEFVTHINESSSNNDEWLIKARQEYAWRKTCENPVTLVVFMAILMGVLVAMSTFRSPAVALMPDVTPKPLRSKANAVINLMGSAGGILVLILGIAFGTGKTENTLMSYTVFFMTAAFIMLAALLVFMLTVKEVKWNKEAEAINDIIDGEAKTTENIEKSKNVHVLSSAEKRSLMFILFSVVLWFMGYNAVISKYSVYAGDVLGLDYNLTLIIAQAAAIISYIPVGIISSKIGRKKTILVGVAILAFSFGAASFMREGSNSWIMNSLFALAGIGWATINVNSYPMVVEMAKTSDTGKYTGYYYTASMAAQIVTPIFSGFFLTYIGMTTLFPYAAVFVSLAFVTMLFVKHGDSKPEDKKELLEMLDIDD